MRNLLGHPAEGGCQRRHGEMENNCEGLEEDANVSWIPPEWVMSSLKSAAGVWSEDDKSPVASRVPNQSAAFKPRRSFGGIRG